MGDNIPYFNENNFSFKNNKYDEDDDDELGILFGLIYQNVLENKFSIPKNKSKKKHISSSPPPSPSPSHSYSPSSSTFPSFDSSEIDPCPNYEKEISELKEHKDILLDNLILYVNKLKELDEFVGGDFDNKKYDEMIKAFNDYKNKEITIKKDNECTKKIEEEKKKINDLSNLFLEKLEENNKKLLELLADE